MKRMLTLALAAALCGCGTAAEGPADGPVEPLSTPISAVVSVPASAAESTEEPPEEPEEAENELIEEALLSRARRIDGCRVTWYCTCSRCNGSNAGKTASGMLPVPGVTCGVDPKVIPLGSDVLVDFGDGNLQYLRATDTGVHGNHIDILSHTHQEALELGTTTATVWWVPR